MKKYVVTILGNVWRNASAPFNMNVTDVAELDESAILYNVVPGTYRIYRGRSNWIRWTFGQCGSRNRLVHN